MRRSILALRGWLRARIVGVMVLAQRLNGADASVGSLFHQYAVEALSFGNVSSLLSRLRRRMRETLS
jgi:hypothetical protein